MLKFIIYSEDINIYLLNVRIVFIEQKRCEMKGEIDIYQKQEVLVYFVQIQID